MLYMQTNQHIILSVLTILITFTFLCFPEVAENQYAYSQSTNSTGNATSSGVDLINIHPSPSNVKAGSNFELLAIHLIIQIILVSILGNVCINYILVEYLGR
jgi:hypothetical protein